MSACGVGLVGAQRRRGSSWSARSEPWNAQLCQEPRQGWEIVGLPRSQCDDQRQAVAVNQGVSLGGQPAAGASDRMIIRLDCVRWILVIRPRPLCGNLAHRPTSQRLRRAGEPAPRSSRPRVASRSRHEHRPGPATRTGPCPKSRRSRTGGDASRPSATDRRPREDHATQHQSGSGRSRPRPGSGDHASACPSAPSPAAEQPRSGPTSRHQAPPSASSAQHQARTPPDIGDTP